MSRHGAVRAVVAARLSGSSFDEIAAKVIRRGLIRDVRSAKFGVHDWRCGVILRVSLAITNRRVGAAPGEVARIGISRAATG